MEWNVTTASLPPGFSARFGGGQCGDKLPQLVIHRDTQALKGACRGMDLPRFLARQTGFDDAGEPEGRLDGRLGALGHDGARDAARGALFAVIVDDIGQKRLGRFVDQIGRQRALPAPCACRPARRAGRKSRVPRGRAAWRTRRDPAPRRRARGTRRRRRVRQARRKCRERGSTGHRRRRPRARQARRPEDPGRPRSPHRPPPQAIHGRSHQRRRCHRATRQKSGRPPEEADPEGPAMRRHGGRHRGRLGARPGHCASTSAGSGRRLLASEMGLKNSLPSLNFSSIFRTLSSAAAPSSGLRMWNFCPLPWNSASPSRPSFSRAAGGRTKRPVSSTPTSLAFHEIEVFEQLARALAIIHAFDAAHEVVVVIAREALDEIRGGVAIGDVEAGGIAGAATVCRRTAGHDGTWPEARSGPFHPPCSGFRLETCCPRGLAPSGVAPGLSPFFFAALRPYSSVGNGNGGLSNAATAQSAALVPSLGVRLRMPPGGMSARLRAGSLSSGVRDCLYEPAVFCFWSGLVVPACRSRLPMTNGCHGNISQSTPFFGIFPPPSAKRRKCNRTRMTTHRRNGATSGAKCGTAHKMWGNLRMGGVFPRCGGKCRKKSGSARHFPAFRGVRGANHPVRHPLRPCHRG